jgi:HEAT repeats
MKSIIRSSLCILLGASFAGASGASEQELSKQLLQQDGWVAYQVPMVAGAGSPCCLEYNGKHETHVGCDLDGHSWNVGHDDNKPQSDDAMLAVYLHVTHAQVDKMRAFGASCAVRDGERVRRLEHVDSADSVALLTHDASADDAHDIVDIKLAALAMHADASATTALAQLAGSTHPRKLREQALFWSAQLRGADGAHLVEHIATTDADAELRANAVFALSQAKGVDGYASILRIAHTDASEHVREQALFWMAQMGDARARNDILTAIDKETSDHVREQAVFALSQLKDDQAATALIALVRGSYPRKVKEQALFWLGQSGSTEAMNFLDEVLSKKVQRSKDT